MDNITPEQRSENMRRIRSKGMQPELMVRRMTHGMGYRYRLHGSKLPGKPDLVFSSRKKVIFIHGCFWHQHKKCRISRIPKSNQDYWIPKLERNRIRDRKNQIRLKKLGWKRMVIWECELKSIDKIGLKIREFLDSGN